MRVACNRCQTQYEVPDEKLARGAVKVRCSQCGHIFGVRTRGGKVPAEEPAPTVPDLGDAGAQFPPQPEPPAPSPDAGTGALPEARFEDFEFPAPPEQDVAPEATPSSFGHLEGLSDSDMASLGELDLGDFDDLDKDLDLRGEPLPGATAAPGEPVERVSEGDLLSSRSREMPVQGLSEELPRLDIQRGPRRQETPGKPSPLVARDRRRSPLYWVVVVVALGTLSYTGYNLYRHPEAFTFLNPAKIRALWQRRQIEARFNVEGLSGDYLGLSAGRRAFVIRGDLINRSNSSQSILRVQGTLYGSDGATLASREVFCGNVLSDAELKSLPEETIEARLQNEVGQAMSNMEVPPGGRVGFMVVFPSPPDGVEKFSARPVGARAGAGG